MRVLAYHQVNDVLQFERQVCYLKRHYNILSYKDFKQLGNQDSHISKNDLIITFDDGDISNYKNAFPILKKHGISAILFVITDLINSSKPFWWDEMEYHLGKEEGNKKVWEVKTLPNSEREFFLDKLRNSTSRPPLKSLQLTTSQLREMDDSGILIGNHSHTHPMFDKCTSKELEVEMKRSNTILSYFDFSPEYFAYPNGNYSKEAEEQLKRNGVKYAFLFDHRINKGIINPLRISRLIVNDTTPLWKFRFILNGWHSRILPLTKALGKLRK